MLESFSFPIASYTDGDILNQIVLKQSNSVYQL